MIRWRPTALAGRLMYVSRSPTEWQPRHAIPTNLLRTDAGHQSRCGSGIRWYCGLGRTRGIDDMDRVLIIRGVAVDRNQNIGVSKNLRIGR